MVGSPTGVLMQDTTYPTFKALAQEYGYWKSVKLSPYPNVTLQTGATIRFRTAEDPERMRGPNLSGVWLDEASLMPEAAFTVCIASLREAGWQGWLTATFTPQGLTHWTYDRFGKVDPDTELFRARTIDNPFNPDGFAEKLALQYGPERAKQELEGQFIDVAGAEWPGSYFPESIWFDEWPVVLDLKVMALDPSKGKGQDRPTVDRKRTKDPDKLGDYSAYVLLARGRDGLLYVDADLDQRRDITRIILDGLALCRTFRPEAFAVEVNQFQCMMAAEFERLAKETRTHIPLWHINNSENKEMRIRTLTPYLAQGQLRFKRGSRGSETLVRQLRDFPMADHDDGPDALEMAIRLGVQLWNGRQAPRPTRLVV